MRAKSHRKRRQQKRLTTHKSYKKKGITMKIRLLSLATLLCAFGAMNAQAESIGDAMEKCRNTDNSLKRLMCFDKVAKSLNQYDGVNAEIGQLQTYRGAANNSKATSPAAKPSRLTSQPENEFGLEHKRDLTKEASEILVSIKSLKKSLRDKYVISFSDGSVWQQTDDTYMKLKEGQPVAVERGLLGAFFLSVEGLNKRMKVKRVK